MPGAQPGRAAQPGRRQPAVAGHLERALESVLVGVELGGWQRERRLAAAGQVPEADDGQLGPSGSASKSSALGAAPRRGAPPGRRSPRSGGRSRSVPRCFHDIHSLSARQRRVPSKLELVEVQLRRSVRGRRRDRPGSGRPSADGAARALPGVSPPPVVLGRAAAEDLARCVAVADEQAADVVGLEEPLVRIDRDRIGPIEVRDPAGVARADSRAAPP